MKVLKILAVLSAIGSVVYILTPRFAAPRVYSPENEVHNTLRSIYGAADQYMLENNATSVTSTQLESYFPRFEGGFENIFRSHLGETYTDLTIHADDTTLSVQLGDGSTFSIDTSYQMGKGKTIESQVEED